MKLTTDVNRLWLKMKLQTDDAVLKGKPLVFAGVTGRQLYRLVR